MKEITCDCNVFSSQTDKRTFSRWCSENNKSFHRRKLYKLPLISVERNDCPSHPDEISQSWCYKSLQQPSSYVVTPENLEDRIITPGIFP